MPLVRPPDCKSSTIFCAAAMTSSFSSGFLFQNIGMTITWGHRTSSLLFCPISVLSVEDFHVAPYSGIGKTDTSAVTFNQDMPVLCDHSSQHTPSCLFSALLSQACCKSLRMASQPCLYRRRWSWASLLFFHALACVAIWSPDCSFVGLSLLCWGPFIWLPFPSHAQCQILHSKIWKIFGFQICQWSASVVMMATSEVQHDCCQPQRKYTLWYCIYTSCMKDTPEVTWSSRCFCLLCCSSGDKPSSSFAFLRLKRILVGLQYLSSNRWKQSVNWMLLLESRWSRHTQGTLPLSFTALVFLTDYSVLGCC